MEVPVNPDERERIRANSVIFTLFADVAHRSPGADEPPAIPISALVGLMEPLGVSAAAVRQAASRLARQGWLAARRHGKRAVYAVTRRGLRRIADLSPRIYGPVVEWDGRWRLIVLDSGGERSRRDRMCKELGVLGWAVLTGSTWISPGSTISAAAEAARSHGVGAHAFTGGYDGPLTDRELIARCWDLPAIAEAYRRFVAIYQPRLALVRDGESWGDMVAFVERLRLVHEYRKFAYLDPGLPSELVPASWPRSQAAAVFRSYYDSLEEGAVRFFRRQTEGEANASNRGRHAQTRLDSSGGDRAKYRDPGLQQ